MRAFDRAVAAQTPPDRRRGLFSGSIIYAINGNIGAALKPCQISGQTGWGHLATNELPVRLRGTIGVRSAHEAGLVPFSRDIPRPPIKETTATPEN
jgi:hypothetical protein